MAITFAFHEDDSPGHARSRQAILSVQDGLAAFLPAETITAERDPITGGDLRTIFAIIGNAECRLAEILDIAKSETAQKLDRQSLCLGIFCECETGPRAVAALVEEVGFLETDSGEYGVNIAAGKTLQYPAVVFLAATDGQRSDLVLVRGTARLISTFGFLDFGEAAQEIVGIRFRHMSVHCRLMR